MKFPCTIERLASGGCVVRHQSATVGKVEVRGPSREEALEKMRNELRYRLELCPCTGEQFQHLEIEVVEAYRGA